MEQLTSTLITQGGFGLVAGIMYWLYISERKDHQRTRDKYEISLEARRVDAKESFERVVEPLENISRMNEYIADKLIMSKKRKN